MNMHTCSTCFLFASSAIVCAANAIWETPLQSGNKDLGRAKGRIIMDASPMVSREFCSFGAPQLRGSCSLEYHN